MRRDKQTQISRKLTNLRFASNQRDDEKASPHPTQSHKFTASKTHQTLEIARRMKNKNSYRIPNESLIMEEYRARTQTAFD